MSYDDLLSHTAGQMGVAVGVGGVRNTGTARKSSFMMGFDDEMEILQSGVRKVTNVIAEESVSGMPLGRKS